MKNRGLRVIGLAEFTVFIITRPLAPPTFSVPAVTCFWPRLSENLSKGRWFGARKDEDCSRFRCTDGGAGRCAYVSPLAASARFHAGAGQARYLCRLQRESSVYEVK